MVARSPVCACKENGWWRSRTLFYCNRKEPIRKGQVTVQMRIFLIYLRLTGSILCLFNVGCGIIAGLKASQQACCPNDIHSRMLSVPGRFPLWHLFTSRYRKAHSRLFYNSRRLQDTEKRSKTGKRIVQSAYYMLDFICKIVHNIFRKHFSKMF